MKKFWNGFKNLLNTFLNIISFGLIKINKNLRKEYRVELLKVKLNDTKMKMKESTDKKISIYQEIRVHENKIKRHQEDLDACVVELNEAKDSDDVVKFNDMAVRYKTLSSILEEENKVLDAYKNAKEIIESNISVLNTDIRKMKYEIDVIEAKQKTYESLKEVNDVMADIHLPNGTDNTSNINEINAELDDDLTREKTKNEIIKENIPTADIIEYNTKDEMESFLKTVVQK